MNITLGHTPGQALLVAKAGARYVSPFLGRIDNYLREEKLGWKLVDKNPEERQFMKSDYYPAGGVEKDGEIVHDNGIISGVHLIEEIMEIFDKYDFDTEVIAASIRNPRQVREIAKTGVHIATIPFPVLKKMTQHHLTAEGVRKFLEDVDKVPEYRELF